MDLDTFYERVELLMFAKYDIDPDILVNYQDLIEQYFIMGYSPRRAITSLAREIYQID